MKQIESEGSNVSAIQELRVNKVSTLMKVTTNGVTVHWQPDTGTDRDIIDEGMFNKLQNRVAKKIKLMPTKVNLYPYGSKTSLNIIGCFKSKLRAGKQK